MFTPYALLNDTLTSTYIELNQLENEDYELRIYFPFFSRDFLVLEKRDSSKSKITA